MTQVGGPKAASQICTPQRDHPTAVREVLSSKVDYAARDGDGGFAIGQLVCVRDGVRPRQYAGRQGAVAEVRRVVPKEIADALHAQGKCTNNGDFEIGVDFSSEAIIENLRASAWFLPRELARTKAIHRRSKAPSSPASPEPSASIPPVAASVKTEPSR